MNAKSLLPMSRILACAGVVVLAWLPPIADAQLSDPKHTDHQQTGNGAVQDQLHALQENVAKLEAALKQQHSAMPDDGKMSTGMKDEIGMKKKMGMGKMSGMKSDKMPDMKMDGDKKGMGGKEMGGMSGGGMGMMGKDKGMKMGMGMMSKGMMSKGMMMMGKMKSMGDMDMPSSLPGFPGASHIYHIGADSFFLDHAEHITLTTQQQSILNKVKEEAILKQADFDRQIESAEQEVWVLTSSDSPDAKKIEDKISEVAKLQADQRIAYIRAVGEAAKTLTDQQRGALTGDTKNEEAEK